MRKAAQYIFATPPSSSFEEALQHFEEAEKRELKFMSCLSGYFKNCPYYFSLHPYICKTYHCVVKPGFYSSNWLYIGKCYIKLGKTAEAKPWLQKTVEYNGVLLGDDKEVGYNKVFHSAMISTLYKSY